MTQLALGLLDGSVVRVDPGDMSAVAAHQHDALSRRQLVALGLTRDAIAHRVARGRLRPLHRGVYGTARPHALQAIAAALLATHPAVASHRTAAYLWGLVRTPPPLPEVTVQRGRRPRHPRIRVHRAATADRCVHQGLPVTAAARTLLDLAATRPPHELARALTEAHVKDLARGPELEAAIATGRPGARVLRAALRAGIHRTRSRPERDLLALCREARLPLPQVNTRVEGFEVDAVWHDRRLVVEIDTFGTHGHPRAFAADHHRDLTLRAAMYEVVRLSDEQLAYDRVAVSAILAVRLRLG